MITVRKAVVADVPKIYELVKDFARQGVMLPRSLSELYDVIRDFHVAEDSDTGRMVGACAVHVCWEGLGEVRSLSVSPGYQGRDLGRRLFDACLADAAVIGLERLFVLTYIPDYFKRFDFLDIERSKLPHKIWADCIKCVNFPECGESALERLL
jgi:amino-acid N-acetyltransferase